MEALLSILTSTGAGGIIGVVGSWLTKREERKNIQLQFERDVKLAEIRKDEAKIEADHELALADKQIERAQVEGSVAIDQAEVEAFTEGLKEQSKTYGIKAVDGIRGLMRPIITVYLLIIATLLTLKINQLVGGLDSLELSELKGIYDNVINQMLFLTATAVTWWFGSRPSSQRRD
ncbi:MAG: hypothetical protein P8O99_05045 [Pseudomonadales bacterium]|nr:hypothetical protein [Pseudomonadales bacterium]